MTDAKSGSGPKAVDTNVNPRDALRSKILGAKQERVSITLFGAEIEILQPSVGDVVKQAESSPQSMVVQLLLNNAYVPGTKIKVFDEADLDGLLNRPFGTEMRRVSQLMNQLMGIEVEGVAEVKGNLEQTH